MKTSQMSSLRRRPGSIIDENHNGILLHINVKSRLKTKTNFHPSSEVNSFRPPSSVNSTWWIISRAHLLILVLKKDRNVDFATGCIHIVQDVKNSLQSMRIKRAWKDIWIFAVNRTKYPCHLLMLFSPLHNFCCSCPFCFTIICCYKCRCWCCCCCCNNSFPHLQYCRWRRWWVYLASWHYSCCCYCCCT